LRKLAHEEISKHRVPLDQIQNRPRAPIYALIDNVRSLYNVGSIFRTSDGAFIRKLFLCGFTPHPPRKEIEKTALGSTQSVPWEYNGNPVEVIEMLKKQGVNIAVLELTDESIPYYRLHPADFPLCLVVGNEITGVRKEILDVADIAIEIPMFGVKQSLNVAVAYGIATFELIRIQNHFNNTILPSATKSPARNR
jgi:tRNA G18 (ribose-2'-O)-methylase SpoU